MDPDIRRCGLEGCNTCAGSAVTGCPTCQRYWCSQHWKAPEHICDSLSDDDGDEVWRNARLQRKIDNYARIFIPEITSMAEQLRPVHTCLAREPPSMGSNDLSAGMYHVHIQLDFDDGVKWWARVRQEGFELPGFDIGRLLMESEIATQQRMHAAGLAMPEIMQAPVDSSTLNVCFVEHVDGIGWKWKDSTEVSEKDHRTIRDYARFSIKLSALEFDATGSLELSDIKVGPFRSNEYLDSKPPYFFGPFISLGAMYIAWLERLMGKVVEETFMKTSAVPWYLMALEIRQMIVNDPDLMNTSQPTHFKHGDSRDGDHIRVDGKGNMTGIIDWELAVTTPKADAFAAPICFMDWNAFYHGSNALSPMEEALANAYSELGREDLAICVRGAKEYQRLEHGVGYLLQWRGFSALIEAMTGSGPVEATCEEWTVMAERKWAPDADLQKLQIRNGEPNI